MKVSEFKAQLADIPEYRPEELDRLVIQWLREGAKDFGPGCAHTVGKLLDIVADLMEIES